MAWLTKLELKIPPLVLWLVSATVAALSANTFSILSIQFLGSKAIGALLVSVGITLGVLGVIEFRRSKTSLNPLEPSRVSSFVTTGIYRFTRNPMYLGMAFALFGVATWTSNLIGALITALFCSYMTRFQIVPEERILFMKYGQEFKNYCARVRRWL